MGRPTDEGFAEASTTSHEVHGHLCSIWPSYALPMHRILETDWMINGGDVELQTLNARRQHHEGEGGRKWHLQNAKPKTQWGYQTIITIQYCDA